MAASIPNSTKARLFQEVARERERCEQQRATMRVSDLLPVLFLVVHPHCTRFQAQAQAAAGDC